MKALIIYHTVYGNTKQVAEEIAAGLSGRYEVRMLAASDFEPIADDIDLLLVGGPTHNHGLSDGMRDLLERLPDKSLHNMPVAAFDTRYHMARWMTGSAAIRIERALKHKGAHRIIPSESFFVASEKLPEGKQRDAETEHLEAGEAERARAWGSEIAALAVPVA